VHPAHRPHRLLGVLTFLTIAAAVALTQCGSEATNTSVPVEAGADGARDAFVAPKEGGDVDALVLLDGAKYSGTMSDGGACTKAEPPTRSGVASALEVSDFTKADREAMCRWASHVYGGYGCRVACAGGLELAFYEDESTCLVNLLRPGCAATADEVERCMLQDAADMCAASIIDGVGECKTWHVCHLI